MPVEPCRECGGSGIISVMVAGFATSSGEDEKQSMSCSRCGGTPQLKRTALGNRYVEAEAFGADVGWFCPDPDTVEPRCVIGEAPVWDIEQMTCMAWELSPKHTCRWVWVEVPTALEEATD